jgi:extracellular matrix regulatory protein A
LSDSHPIHRVASGSAKAATVAPSHVPRSATARLLNVGYGNLVTASRVVAIVAPTASPMRRLRHEAAERGKLVDATEGRRTRSIVILDSDHVVLSAINP